MFNFLRLLRNAWFIAGIVGFLLVAGQAFLGGQGTSAEEEDDGHAVLCDYVCNVTDQDAEVSKCEWYCEDPQFMATCTNCDYICANAKCKFECTECDTGTY